MRICRKIYTVDPTYGSIVEKWFGGSKIKLVGLFCHVSVQKDLRVWGSSFHREDIPTGIDFEYMCVSLSPNCQWSSIWESGSGRQSFVSRIDTIIGLFFKRALQKRLYSAKETCTHFEKACVFSDWESFYTHMDRSIERFVNWFTDR